MKNLITLVFLFIIVLTYAQVPSYVPTNGLVGWWPFNGNANDESGNGNNGSIGTGVVSAIDRFSISNACYNFNGSGNISLTSLPTVGNQNFSISAWVNTNNTTQRKGIACWGQDSPWQSTYFFITNTGFLSFGFAYNGGPASPTFIADNQWHHVAVTNVNGLIQLYLDGYPTAQPLQMTPDINGINKALGANIDNSGSNNFIGSLDDIGIWNRALTEAEILALYEDCQLAITTQPQDQSVATSIGSASFVAASSSTNATYQWQTNLGLGYQNISNAGQYSGATSASLSVSNLSMANDNQVFRCIVNDGSCADTTAEATLTIIDDAGIQNITVSSIKLYPNPAQDVLYIDGLAGKEFEYEVLSIEGKLLQKGKSQGEIDLKELKKGNYVLRIGQQQVAFVKQ